MVEVYDGGSLIGLVVSGFSRTMGEGLCEPAP